MKNFLKAPNFGRRTFVSTLLTILLAQISLTAIMYSKLPLLLAVHFNIKNQPDFYMHKALACGLLGLITLSCCFVFYLFSKSRTERFKVGKFRFLYCFFTSSIAALILLLQGLIFLYNLGFEFNLPIIVFVYLLALVLPLTITLVRTDIKR